MSHETSGHPVFLFAKSDDPSFSPHLHPGIPAVTLPTAQSGNLRKRYFPAGQESANAVLERSSLGK